MLLEMYAVWWVVGERTTWSTRGVCIAIITQSSCISSRQEMRRGGEEKSKTTEMANNWYKV